MNVVSDTIQSLRTMRKRQLAHQVINLGLIVTSALMIWKSLMVITSSESPVVVVLSGSMEPAFQRGDILFLWLGSASFRVGEIVVFKIEGRDIPIVHRVIKVHEKYDGAVDVLTKGDNNDVDDRGLYAPDQRWLNKKHIIGRAVGYLPYVGMVTIIMNDYPYLKVISAYSFAPCGMPPGTDTAQAAICLRVCFASRGCLAVCYYLPALLAMRCMGLRWRTLLWACYAKRGTDNVWCYGLVMRGAGLT